MTDPEFAEEMAIARQIIDESAEVLRPLAGIDHEWIAAHKREQAAQRQARSILELAEMPQTDNRHRIQG
jgi:hypothetical protein